MNELEKKIERLREIQNQLEVLKDFTEFMKLAQEAQEIINWMDSMPHNIRV